MGPSTHSPRADHEIAKNIPIRPAPTRKWVRNWRYTLAALGIFDFNLLFASAQKPYDHVPALVD
jgi:hypothetical protein